MRHAARQRAAILPNSTCQPQVAVDFIFHVNVGELALSRPLRYCIDEGNIAARES